MKITTLRETTMKKMSLKIAAMTLIFGACASNSFAAIVGGTVTMGGGSFVELTVPFTESDPDNTVGFDNFNDDDLYAFNENQNVLLLADLNVDNLANGLGGETLGGTLSAGIFVSSHYVFFDPAGFFPLTSQEGTVTFDSPILAILTSTGNLNSTDVLLGDASVNYVTSFLRGLEGDDVVSITGLTTISVNWDASFPGDYVRVLTAAVPEPSTFLLAALSLLSMGCHRRKRA